MKENKQEILDLLLPCMRMTRAGQELTALTFDAWEETVTAEYATGETEEVNVACDSGAAMIYDVVRALI